MTSTTSARRKARYLALQALYQWQLAGADLNVIEAEFHADQDMNKVDSDYFHQLLHGVPGGLTELDQVLEPLLDRPLADLDPVTLCLLRLSGYELCSRIDVPYRVVINEAVSLAKKFGPTDSHKFVNGVLDRAASYWRAPEVKAAGRG